MLKLLLFGFNEKAESEIQSLFQLMVTLYAIYEKCEKFLHLFMNEQIKTQIIAEFQSSCRYLLSAQY